MNLAGFAESIGGEFVAGCLLATVNGKRQYLYRDGQFTLVGRPLYLAWENEPREAIAIPEPETPRKLHRGGRNRHG
jgi:hypothetical protein